MIAGISGINNSVRYNPNYTKSKKISNNVNYNYSNVSFGANPINKSTVKTGTIAALCFLASLIGLSNCVDEYSKKLANDRIGTRTALYTPKYVVAKEGDTYWGIANDNNLTMKEMAQYNPHLLKIASDGLPAIGNSWSDFKMLQPGDTINLNDIDKAKVVTTKTYYNSDTKEEEASYITSRDINKGEEVPEITDEDGKPYLYKGNGNEGSDGIIYSTLEITDGHGHSVDY